MPDIVDKTFDTVYYYTQRVSNATSNAADVVIQKTNSASNIILSKIKTVDVEKTSNVQNRSTSGDLFNGIINSIVGIPKNAKKHKTFATVLGIALLGVSGYSIKKLYESNKLSKRSKTKRRAFRLPNGARKDVVLIVGSVIEPLTRYIANDLENRGFIVYITSTNTKADLRFFNNESIQDIKSLTVSSNFSSAFNENNDFNYKQIQDFDYLLSSEHVPFQGAEPNKLNLVGILVIPDLYLPKGKFHLIPSSSVFDNINKNALLPLNLLSNGLIGIAEKYDSNIIFITPTISSSLELPYHSIENITSNFVQDLSKNLANDYPDLNVTNLKLGAININSNNNRKNYGIKGIPLKILHYKIFDLIYSDYNNSIDYVGFGARFLHTFGSWIPNIIIRNYFNNYFEKE